MKGTRVTWSMVLLAAAAVTGCAGDPVMDAGTSLRRAQPLPTVARAEWEDALSGCTGELTANAEFGIADGAPDLVVVFDESGSPVCVDTFSAVEAELSDRDAEASEALWLDYIAALEVEPLTTNESTPFRALIRPGTSVAGDPNPQPSRPRNSDGPQSVDTPGSGGPSVPHHE